MNIFDEIGKKTLDARHDATPPQRINAARRRGGPGKWQRLIIEELKHKEAFALRSLLGRKYTKAQYNALLRAALEMEATYKIGIKRFAYGGARTYVHRHGTTVNGVNRRRLDEYKCESRSLW